MRRGKNLNWDLMSFRSLPSRAVQGRPGPRVAAVVRVLLSSLERSQWRDGMCDISNLARLGVLGHHADDEREPHLAKEMRELGTECRRLLRGWTASLSGHVWQSKFGLARRSRFSSHELRPRRVESTGQFQCAYTGWQVLARPHAHHIRRKSLNSRIQPDHILSVMANQAPSKHTTSDLAYSIRIHNGWKCLIPGFGPIRLLRDILLDKARFGKPNGITGFRVFSTPEHFGSYVISEWVRKQTQERSCVYCSEIYSIHMSRSLIETCTFSI